MMVAGGLVLGFSLVVIGLLYATNAADRSAVRWTIIALIEVYVIGFSTTWAMTSRLYAAEIQPAKTRATATGVGQCAWLYRTNLTTGVNQAVNFVVALTTPLFLSKVRERFRSQSDAHRATSAHTYSTAASHSSLRPSASRS